MESNMFDTVKKGEVDKLRCLLDCGGKIHCQDENASNLLHVAVHSNQVEIAKLLIERAPQLAMEKNSWGRTPLISACIPIVNLEMIKVLVQVKETLEIPDDDGSHRPLHLAASDDEGFEATKLLLASGAKVNALDCKRMSVINLAIRNGNQAIVQLLLDNNARLVDRDFLAVDVRHFWSILKLLLAVKPAGVNAKNYSAGYTLLMQTAKFGEANQVQELLRLGADINAKASNGVTALMEAVKAGDSDVVKVLLSSGADPLAQDNKGRTILSLACKCEYRAEDMLKLILKIGAFKTPSFSFVSPEIHPQSIVLRKRRSPVLLKIIAKSFLKNTNLIINEEFMNINLFKIFDSHNMSLGPISYLLHNPECSLVTDETTFKLLQLLVENKYPVNTGEDSVPPLTILFSWDVNEIEDMDDFMRIAIYLINTGKANVNDMSLNIVVTKEEWPVVENLRQETKLPDALLMAFLSRNIPAIELMLPHWSSPPLLLLLLDPEIQPYEIESLYDILAAYNLPVGTQLCKRLSYFLESKCHSCSEGGENKEHSCFSQKFKEMISEPSSLKVLTKYRVRQVYSNAGPNLMQELENLCPPGLRSFLLMIEDADDEEDGSSTTNGCGKRRKCNCTI